MKYREILAEGTISRQIQKNFETIEGSRVIFFIF